MADVHDPVGPQPGGPPEPVQPAPGGPQEPVTPIIPDPTPADPPQRQPEPAPTD